MVQSTVATGQMAVLLIPSAELPEQLPCQVLTLDGEAASIAFDAPTALKRGTRAMLVVGPEGNRQLANTVCAEISEDGARLHLLHLRHFGLRRTPLALLGLHHRACHTGKTAGSNHRLRRFRLRLRLRLWFAWSRALLCALLR